MSSGPEFCMTASANEGELLSSYIDQILGVAIFDPNGLPKEYLATADNYDMGWVQTTFQALGLRLLLMSSLQLEGFNHAVIHGDGYNALIVRQSTGYLALLIREPEPNWMIADFVRWAQGLNPLSLRQDPHFRSA